jgi:glyoxalase family protein
VSVIRGSHHLTFSVGPAQEDYDFHTGLLGLRSIKKTALYDGSTPIYHLYYGNVHGDAGTILTSFPFRQAGVMGKRGSNQIKSLNLAVPTASLGYWADRLRAGGRHVEEAQRFGTQRLLFTHPCGIEYALVGTDEDERYEPWDRSGVPAEHAIRGTYGITISMSSTPDEMIDFLTTGIGAEHGGDEGAHQRFEVGTADTGRGGSIEIVSEPGVEPGTWRFGEGTVHHAAWDVGDGTTQVDLKNFLEDPAHLGEAFQVPPQFADQRDEIVAMLEPISV